MFIPLKKSEVKKEPPPRWFCSNRIDFPESHPPSVDYQRESIPRSIFCLRTSISHENNNELLLGFFLGALLILCGVKRLPEQRETFCTSFVLVLQIVFSPFEKRHTLLTLRAWKSTHLHDCQRFPVLSHIFSSEACFLFALLPKIACNPVKNCFRPQFYPGEKKYREWRRNRESGWGQNFELPAANSDWKRKNESGIVKQAYVK